MKLIINREMDIVTGLGLIGDQGGDEWGVLEQKTVETLHRWRTKQRGRINQV